MLYPHILPFQTHYIKVSKEHTLYVEQVGNPQGIPIVFLHGGPGSGLDETHRRFFDPQKFHVILYDQRGCGKSQPIACTSNNTTADLIQDLEKIRDLVGIKTWHVFGGSWGSFLALAYSQAYPERVRSLILRGLFLGSNEEISFFYQKGASFVFPEAYETFVSILTDEEKIDCLSSFYKRLQSHDESIRQEAARHWTFWEASALRLINTPKTIAEFAKKDRVLSLAMIETHYFMNGCFITPNQLLDDIYKLKDIPITLVHGRYDMICPFETAYKFKKQAPHTDLIVCETAGHSGYEEPILEALLKTLDSIR
jgi:proline iminopeptidase